MSKQASHLFLIASIITAIIIVGGAILYVNMAAAPTGSGGKPVSLAQEGDVIAIPDGMKTCREGQSCLVVDRSCGLCCNYEPINALHEELFDQIFDATCADYKGQTCSCFDLGSYPACVDGRCALLKWDNE